MPSRAKRHRKKSRRPSAAGRGYDHWWQQYSARYKRQHPLCVCCLARGKRTPACLVDHIVPFRTGEVIDEHLRKDPANHQPLCDHRFDDCHNVHKKPIEEQHAGDADAVRRAWFNLLEKFRDE